MRYENLLKSRVSEICVKRIFDNKGVGAIENQFMAFSYYITRLWILSIYSTGHECYKQFVMKTKIIFVKTNLQERFGCIGGLFGYNANIHTWRAWA